MYLNVLLLQVSSHKNRRSLSPVRFLSLWGCGTVGVVQCLTQCSSPHIYGAWGEETKELMNAAIREDELPREDFKHTYVLKIIENQEKRKTQGK